MKKIIAFSLWGKHEFYNYGALENALLAKQIYPGWICRFYYLENGCDPKIIKLLKEQDNVELVAKQGSLSNLNTFWRFEPAFYEDDIIYLSRDTDSRLNVREKAAVDQWLSSDKNFHIMRDHPEHLAYIMAGMWGCRNNMLRKLKDEYQKYQTNNKIIDLYGIDQTFLKNIVYPHVVASSMIHATFHKKEKQCLDFPTTKMDSSKTKLKVPRSMISSSQKEIVKQNDNGSFVGSYVRTAPLTFALLKEPVRLLNTVHSYQALSVNQ